MSDTEEDSLGSDSSSSSDSEKAKPNQINTKKKIKNVMRMQIKKHTDTKTSIMGKKLEMILVNIECKTKQQMDKFLRA